MTSRNSRRLTVGERVGGPPVGMFVKTHELDARFAEPMKELDRWGRGSGLSSGKAATRCC
jgi:hypothetical protein